jgi:hypothetical protein
MKTESKATFELYFNFGIELKFTMLKSKWNITLYNIMKNFDINEDPHRRYNPLINEWVLVSPHRSKRPGRTK